MVSFWTSFVGFLLPWWGGIFFWWVLWDGKSIGPFQIRATRFQIRFLAGAVSGYGWKCIASYDLSIVAISNTWKGEKHSRKRKIKLFFCLLFPLLKENTFWDHLVFWFFPSQLKNIEVRKRNWVKFRAPKQRIYFFPFTVVHVYFEKEKKKKLRNKSILDGYVINVAKLGPFRPLLGTKLSWSFSIFPNFLLFSLIIVTHSVWRRKLLHLSNVAQQSLLLENIILP